MRFLTVLSISLVLVACGGDSAGGSAAGTYTLDADAMMPEIESFIETMIKPQLEMMEKAFAALPAEQREAQEEAAKAKIEAQMAEQKAKMRKELDLTVTLAEGGSFVALKGDETKAKGTWKLDGSTVTFTTTEQDGKKQDPPETITGKYDEGTIRFRPDENMPFDLIMRKQ